MGGAKNTMGLIQKYNYFLKNIRVIGKIIILSLTHIVSLHKTFYYHQKCSPEKWIKCKKKMHHFMPLWPKQDYSESKQFIGDKLITIA